MNPKMLDLFDRSYLLHRYEVVLTWPESAHKAALLDAITHRLVVLQRQQESIREGNRS